MNLRLAATSLILGWPDGVSAFIPSPRQSVVQRYATTLDASLSDQLSQLSYESAVTGKKIAGSIKASAATKASASTAAVSTSAKAATATAVASSSTPALSTPIDGQALTVGLPDINDITSKLTLLAAQTKLTADETLASVATVIQTYETVIDEKFTANPLIGSMWEMAKESLGPLLPKLLHPDLPPSIAILIASYVTYSVLNTILSFGQEPPPTSPYPMNRYDAVSARRYFDGKLTVVLARAIQVAFLSGTFLVALASDYLAGKLQSNSDQRAEELSVLLTKLGPSFIKIGQSLSIRTDLLSPAYVRGLKSLQDQVPPFSTAEAREIIENELGAPIDDLFVKFPNEPIAAASLGQVYRATIRTTAEDGSSTEREVAVKVQRPNIMNQIALDMHLIREAAPFFKRTFNLNSDLVGTVDAWGVGFVDELDYIEEAVNAKTFMESISQTPLSGVVFSPPVLDELTTRKVLTTEWVVGERLDRSGKDDVSILCSIAMNTYLTMMLETGVLHCDPHPGNLLRTTDGKLCILDWGMVTKLESDLQLTLIEHMAHLTSADYEEIPKDLLLLGFIPESKADLIKDSGVVETLADIYGAWTSGGGAAAINVNKVVSQLQDLTAEKGNLFQIPPYFAYIAKSFSVLEGIGLSNDPKYSIINECLPYVSKRLLTDKSERTGGALSTFIFGPNKNSQDRIIDYDRVEQLVSGFGDYTTSASGELLGKNSTRAEIIEGVTEQCLDLLASEEETPLQSIFIEQLAKIITSSTRSAWSRLLRRSGVLPSGRTVLGTIVDPFGVFRTSPIVRSNELDERTVETTRNLIQLVVSSNGNAPILDVSSLSNAEIIEITSTIVRKVWEKRNGVVKTGNRLAMQLLQLTADRLERGEREILVIPTRTSRDSTSNNDGRIHEAKTEEAKVTSERLAGARKILQQIEK